MDYLDRDELFAAEIDDLPRVADASAEMTEKAETGPHGHWSTFDCKLEGARFHRLGELVAAETFDAVEAESLIKELKSLAQSYGYGQADSFFFDAGQSSLDEINENPHLATQYDNVFVNDGEHDQYFTEIKESENALLLATATKEARQFLVVRNGQRTQIYSEMQDGFIQGRVLRSRQEVPNSPKP